MISRYLAYFSGSTFLALFEAFFGDVREYFL